MRSRWRCRLHSHSVGAQVNLSHAHPVDYMKAHCDQLTGAFLRMRGGRTDRLGWTRIRLETKHEIPLFQSEGEQGIEIEKAGVGYTAILLGHR